MPGRPGLLFWFELGRVNDPFLQAEEKVSGNILGVWRVKVFHGGLEMALSSPLGSNILEGVFGESHGRAPVAVILGGDLLAPGGLAVWVLTLVLCLLRRGAVGSCSSCLPTLFKQIGMRPCLIPFGDGHASKALVVKRERETWNQRRASSGAIRRRRLRYARGFFASKHFFSDTVSKARKRGRTQGPGGRNRLCHGISRKRGEGPPHRTEKKGLQCGLVQSSMNTRATGYEGRGDGSWIHTRFGILVVGRRRTWRLTPT